MRRRLPGRGGRSRGSMSIEIVLLTPVLMAFTLLIVAGGRFIAVQGQIDAAARDAARAASVQRDGSSAGQAALDTWAATRPDTATCATPAVDDGGFRPGGSVTVRVSCQVSYAGLGLIGLPGSADVTSSGVAPIDLYRRTGP